MSLVRQTSTYFLANVGSAAFGLLNVVIFTRAMSAADYGVYIVGFSLATILSTLLFNWLKQALVRNESKADGTDMRATVILGFGMICLPIPIVFFAVNWFVPLDWHAVPAGIMLAVCTGTFDLSIEMLRARQHASQVLWATLLRAVLVTVIGVAAVYLGADGRGLLLATSVAYLTTSLLFMRDVWGRTPVDFSNGRLRYFIAWGIPFTLSIGILALSTTVDRFIVAYMLGASAAGKYSASVDLVRQALIIPAISASAAFVPMAVKILANEGAAATRLHLERCAELLLAITLPSCIGFALLAPRICNMVLGPEFREVAAEIIPIVAVAVAFQIFVQQYLHTSFFLANRNRYYLINTATTLIAGTVLSFWLIGWLGIVGAAWGRVVSELIGMISALFMVGRGFPLPFPLAKIARVGICAAAMGVVVAGLNCLFENWDKTALAVLIPLGAAVYFVACWRFDVAEIRERLSRSSFKLRPRLLR